MRLNSLFLAALLAIAPAFGADAPSADAPQLRGLLAADGERMFSLVSPGGAAPKWVKLGGSFDGWELVDFKAADESLTVRKGARTLVLKMEGSTIAGAGASPGAKATLADAEEVFRKMDFERTIGRILDQQKATMANVTRQIMPPGAGGQDREALAAFQTKMMDAMFEAMNVAEIKSEMVKAYSETFTRDELRGLADFYGTPAGIALLEKQPQVSEKLNAVMVPRLMAAMPKIQKMAQEFATEQMNKQGAGARAGAPTAPGGN